MKASPIRKLTNLDNQYLELSSKEMSSAMLGIQNTNCSEIRIQGSTNILRVENCQNLHLYVGSVGMLHIVDCGLCIIKVNCGMMKVVNSHDNDFYV
jgi:hypothetical protein